MANGKFGGGNGTAAKPYLVEDIADLTAIRIKPNKVYRLVNDINMGVPGYEKSSWAPIDNFTGELDGAGHKISNLFIDLPSNTNVGLFSSITDSARTSPRIHDLTIENASVRGRINTGIVVGYLRYSNNTYDNRTDEFAFMKNVCVTGIVSGNESVGGLIGNLFHDSWSNVISTILADVSVNITLRPNAPKTQAGLLIGTSDGDDGTSRIYRAVMEGSTTQTGANSNSYAAWYKASITDESFEDCYCNSDKWLGKVNSGLKAMSGKDFKGVDTFRGLEDKNLKENKKVWIFKEDAAPCLAISASSSFFVEENNNFYIYKDDGWQLIATDELGTEDLKHGMNILDEIPQSAWVKAKNEFGNFNIINAVENYAYANVTKKKENMNRDKNLEKSKAKQKYKKTFSFADLEQGIFCLESL